MCQTIVSKLIGVHGLLLLHKGHPSQQLFGHSGDSLIDGQQQLLVPAVVIPKLGDGQLQPLVSLSLGPFIVLQQWQRTLPQPVLQNAFVGGKVQQPQDERPFTVLPELDLLPPFSEAGSKDQITSHLMRHCTEGPELLLILAAEVSNCASPIRDLQVANFTGSHFPNSWTQESLNLSQEFALFILALDPRWLLFRQTAEDQIFATIAASHCKLSGQGLVLARIQVGECHLLPLWVLFALRLGGC
mmetsp:Transcript_37934/g.62590  ORF Transcript_37934/g.62590 Transcript_37934/m.62590 type:complete len:244 (-) Transcript_37934:192-923(-)